MLVSPFVFLADLPNRKVFRCLLSAMNCNASARPAGFYRVYSLALKPDRKVFFQDQHRFSRLVRSKIAFLDGTMNCVVTAFCQLCRFVYRQGVVQDHFLHTSSTASLSSLELPQTQVTLLMPVASSSRKATAGGQRRRPRMI